VNARLQVRMLRGDRDPAPYKPAPTVALRLTRVERVRLVAAVVLFVLVLVLAYIVGVTR
jgi:hypothetical protein